MGFSLSPSVNVTEKDLTTSIPAVATSIGGTCGQFSWGPVEEISLIDTEANLVKRFGLPDDKNFKDWYTAANFLAYGKNLKVVRTVGTGALNASDSVLGTGTPMLIKNITDFVNNNAAVVTSGESVFAKYPGVAGNDIVVHAIDATVPANFTAWLYAPEFDTGPVGTEVAIVVLKGGAIVEKFVADTLLTAKDYQGTSTYIENIVAQSSQYIWVEGSNISAELTTAAGAAITFTLVAGADGAAPVDADYRRGFDLFLDADLVDVNLLMQGGAPTLTGQYIVQSIAEVRKDCIALVSPDQADVVNTATPETSLALLRQSGAYNFSSSYGVLDASYKFQYDRYNDVYRWVPLNGDIAGLCARTDDTTDPWYSPGGFNRGQIKNVVKLAYNPSKAQRDALYKISINPVVSFAGEGTVLFGDKTMLSKPSAFDRINVRRLFIVLEKAIATAAKFTLFEINNTFTRARFVQMVEPFLREVQGRRGIYDFKVIADSTNNTPFVIDANEFVGDIYIKPSRSINFITLSFNSVATGVVFKEVIG